MRAIFAALNTKGWIGTGGHSDPALSHNDLGIRKLQTSSALALIEQHGAGAKLPDLRAVLARVGATSIYERCGVHYPQLVVVLAP
jgi:hypothetical protein